MLESLKDLNAKCQKKDYKTRGNWMVRNILRDLALPITWLLLHTKVTANQVTLASLIVGILGSYLLSIYSPIVFFMGVLLLQLWYLLDHVDGQIARYYSAASISGRYFDFLMHHLIHGIIPFSMGLHLFLLKGNSLWIIIGFVSSVSTFCFNMIYDIRAKCILEVFDNVNTVNILQSSKSEEGHFKKSNGNPLSKCFSFLHKSYEIHVLINVLFFISLANLFFKIDLRLLTFVYYFSVSIIICVAKNYYVIHHKKIDSFLKENYLLEKSSIETCDEENSV